MTLLIKRANNYLTLLNFETLLSKLEVAKFNEQFLHNKSRLILLAKAEHASSWLDYRPVVIIPAWLSILEAIALPLFKETLNPILMYDQFGFKDHSSCNLAKLRLS